MTESPTVLLKQDVDASTIILSLNRPDRRNALTIELMEAICLELRALASEPMRRVVILCGEGTAFCAGLDLIEAAEVDVAEQSAEWVARTLKALQTSPLVCIAAAHGAAFAGGAGLMASCDLVVAAEDLRVGFPEVRRGLVPALVTATLQQRLRDGDMRELFLLAEPVTAQDAFRMGLVQRIVPSDRLLQEAKSIANLVTAGAPDAIRETKRLLRELRSLEPDRALSQALELHKTARRSAEAVEGLAAFRERRQPNW